MREHHAGRAPEQCQQHTLSEKLSNQAGPARAQGTPQRQFTRARKTAGELKICYICTANQQEKSDTAYERDERFVHASRQVT